MALNWSIDKIKNYRRRCWNKTDKTGSDGKPLYELDPLTNMLIWKCGLAIGISHISDTNWGDVLARLRHLEEERGVALMFRYDKKKATWVPRKITERDVRSHIGLSTNGYDFSWKELKKRTKKIVEDKERAHKAYEARQAEEQKEAS